MMTGFHNFSLSNEIPGGFIQGAPTLETMPSDAEINTLSRGVNWIFIGSPAIPNSWATINFTYGPAPLVEVSRDSYAPGTLATFGVKVHMDSARTVSGTLRLYDHDVVSDSLRPMPTPLFAKNFTVLGTKTTDVEYLIPHDAHTGTWSYVVQTYTKWKRSTTP